MSLFERLVHDLNVIWESGGERHESKVEFTAPINYDPVHVAETVCRIFPKKESRLSRREVNSFSIRKGYDQIAVAIPRSPVFRFWLLYNQSSERLLSLLREARVRPIIYPELVGIAATCPDLRKILQRVVAFGSVKDQGGEGEMCPSFRSSAFESFLTYASPRTIWSGGCVFPVVVRE